MEASSPTRVGVPPVPRKAGVRETDSIHSIHERTRVQDSPIGRRPSLSLGILALLLWALSWSWVVGFGVMVVRVGEIGAIVAGVAAVVVGARTSRPVNDVGLWCGAVTLVLVFALNILGVLLA
jgi:hypothetical protein